MPVIPAGQPAWTRTAIHTNYGGHVNKQNYLSQGVIDAETDVGAEHLARLAADMEACARVAPFCVLDFQCNDSSPAAPTILTVFGMTGVNLVSYAGGSPPSGYPSASRSSTGRNVFTFGSSFSDAYGVSASWSPQHATVSVHGTTAAEGNYVISGQTIDIRIFDAAGVAVGDKRVTLAVW